VQCNPIQPPYLTLSHPIPSHLQVLTSSLPFPSEPSPHPRFPHHAFPVPAQSPPSSPLLPPTALFYQAANTWHPRTRVSGKSVSQISQAGRAFVSQCLKTWPSLMLCVLPTYMSICIHTDLPAYTQYLPAYACIYVCVSVCTLFCFAGWGWFEGRFERWGR
jgi:hypothetical protein